MTYPFPNFNVSDVDVWERKYNFTQHFTGMWLLSHANIKGKPCQ